MNYRFAVDLRGHRVVGSRLERGDTPANDNRYTNAMRYFALLALPSAALIWAAIFILAF